MTTQTLINRRVPGQVAENATSRVAYLDTLASKMARVFYSASSDGTTKAGLDVYGRVAADAPWVLLRSVAISDLDSEGNYAFNLMAMPQMQVVSRVNDATVYDQEVKLTGSFSKPTLYKSVFNALRLQHSDGHMFDVSVALPAGFDAGKKYPVWFLSHGAGGDRRTGESFFNSVTAQGFIACAIDSRGAGSSINLNSAATYGSVGANHIRLIFDVMEMPALLDAALLSYMNDADGIGPVDMDRMFFSGGSNGGIRSYVAAAYSGKLPNTLRGYSAHATGWRGATEAFPSFLATFPGQASPSGAQLVYEGQFTGKAMESVLDGKARAESGARWDPDGPATQGNVLNTALLTEILGYVSVGNPAGLATLLTTDSRFTDIELDLLALVKTTDTHLLASVAYDDVWNMAHDTFDAAKNKTGAGDHILNLAPGGHQSPDNDDETAHTKGQKVAYAVARAFNDESLLSTYFDEATLATLDEARMPIAPASIPSYQGDVLWDETWIADVSVALPAITQTRLYMRPSNVLSGVAPSGSGSGAVSLTWNTATTWSDIYATYEALEDLASYLFVGGTPRLTAGQHYWELALPSGGRLLSDGDNASARLFVGSVDTEFTVAVSLWHGATRFVVLGWKNITGHPTGTIQPYDIDLLPYGFEWAATDDLRVVVEAVAFQRPPLDSGIGFMKSMPSLVDKAFAVYWGAGQQSYIDLPLEAVGTGNL